MKWFFSHLVVCELCGVQPFFLPHFLLLFVAADLICMSCMFISIWWGQHSAKNRKKRISIFYYIIFHLHNHIWIGWALLRFVPHFWCSNFLTVLYISKLEIDLFSRRRCVRIIIICVCVHKWIKNFRAKRQKHSFFCIAPKPLKYLSRIIIIQLWSMVAYTKSVSLNIEKCLPAHTQIRTIILYIRLNSENIQNPIFLLCQPVYEKYNARKWTLNIAKNYIPCST